MSQLTMVWLQSNSLTGPIPDLFNLKVLESFEGPLPSFASKSLIQLLLSNNNLIGTIPDSLAQIHILKIYDVTNNILSGNMPKFHSSIKIETDGNPNLCKNSDSGGESSSPTSGAPSPPDKLSIVGIIIAMVVLVACPVGLLLHHPKKNLKKFELSIESVNPYRDEPQSLHMSIQALKTTTNNFSEDFILGKGYFGIIYKGNLSGTLIVVKKSISDLMGQNDQQELKIEIDVLRKMTEDDLYASNNIHQKRRQGCPDRSGTALNSRSSVFSWNIDDPVSEIS
ncbi:receptor protein kinase TMK1-like [Zingiber officinale]|uniref:receptor protein kinase TMK1-like n=1 Tax=Zingiber officinale TaxID=94328 RepID=UPI001C4B0C27|nr:receptor protein kinase TMK1-like [Zingiber officinale]